MALLSPLLWWWPDNRNFSWTGTEERVKQVLEHLFSVFRIHVMRVLAEYTRCYHNTPPYPTVVNMVVVRVCVMCAKICYPFILTYRYCTHADFISNMLEKGVVLV